MPSSNVAAGGGTGFAGDAVSFTLAQANGPSFVASVSLSAPGSPLAYRDGGNFANFGVPLVSFLPNRTSVYTLPLLHSDPGLAPRTLGTLSIEGIASAFTVLTDGRSGPFTAASCAITYVLNDAVAPGTPIFGARRLPGSGTGDALFDTIAP